MLRTRSSAKGTCWVQSGERLAPALEVEVAAHRDQPLEPARDHDLERRRAQPPVRGLDPTRRRDRDHEDQDSQRLVNAEEMTGALDEVAALAEGLAPAIPRDGGPVVGRKPEQRRLLGGGELPAIEQGEHHAREPAPPFAGLQIHRDPGGFQERLAHRPLHMLRGA